MMPKKTGTQLAMDYARIERALDYLRENFREQPSLDRAADAAALSPYHFQRLFTRWAGVSPKQFLGYLTLSHAKTILDRAGNVLEASCDAGLSGPSRLHDLFVNFEGVTPGEYKAMGEGIDIRYGVHAGLFGNFFVATTDRGICGLQFFGPEGPEAPLARIRGNFPAARFKTAQDETGKLCESIIDPGRHDPGRTLRLWCKGTNFQIRVWAALLSVPPGALVTYGDIASRIDAPTSARAVGAAVGANPVAALIPCHRVIRAETPFRTNYRWGAARKLAMIGWEQARASALRPQSISSTSNIV